MEKKTLLLGGHMPLYENLEDAITNGQNLGFSVIQIYSRSMPDWVKHSMTADQINRFKTALNESTIKEVIALDPFMKHLGRPGLERIELMNDLITDELAVCHLLGIPFLILHPGTCSLRSGTVECITNVSENLNDIISKAPGETSVLLMNMAGGGKSICYTFEHLAQIQRDMNNKNRFGVCFDMCNAFASGYSFGTTQEYNDLWSKFDRVIGLQNLKTIHINDSRQDKNSGVDNHAFIGKGKIPFEAYRLIMNDERFFDIPKIIEIPAEHLDDYCKAYSILVDMITPSNKQMYGID